MQWIIDNWLILLLGVGMIAMHLFGHGHGHGGGGDAHGAHRGPTKEAERSKPETDDRAKDDGNA